MINNYTFIKNPKNPKPLHNFCTSSTTQNYFPYKQPFKH